MARKRTDQQHHALPKYVYIRRGWYVYREHLGKGKLGKDIKLCPATAPISEVWQRFESITCAGAPKRTLDWLMQQYLDSAQHAKKSPKTRAEYEKNYKTLSNTQTKTGERFGDIDAERITPGIIRKYLDARTAPVAANREIAFLSICYSWAVERDIMKTNPCKDVRRNSEKARTRYVTEAEYQAVYQFAADKPHVQAAMEFAYLCRMRLCEVLDLKHSDITQEGLLIRRRKGSRDTVTEITGRLQAAIKLCKTLPMPNARPINPHLIRGKTGGPLTESGFQTLWQRLMKHAEQLGIERFTFHDLKARGITDTDGNKQTASGHKTAAMIDTYNRKPEIVKPAGK